MNQFSKTDFNSADGMLTSVWGPSFWHFLHTMSFNYPNRPTKQQKQQYYDFIVNIQNVLPCKYCRQNLPNNLRKVGFNRHVFRNRCSFSTFIYKLHNEVNTMLGKPCTLSYDDVRQRYEHFRSRCLDKKTPARATRQKPALTVCKKKKSSKNKGNTMQQREKGCIDSFYGKKAKCIIRIVPTSSKQPTFTMNNACYIKKIS